jgi:hypothetical protein
MYSRTRSAGAKSPFCEYLSRRANSDAKRFALESHSVPYNRNIRVRNRVGGAPTETQSDRRNSNVFASDSIRPYLTVTNRLRPSKRVTGDPKCVDVRVLAQDLADERDCSAELSTRQEESFANRTGSRGKLMMREGTARET